METMELIEAACAAEELCSLDELEIYAKTQRDGHAQVETEVHQELHGQHAKELPGAGA